MKEWRKSKTVASRLWRNLKPGPLRLWKRLKKAFPSDKKTEAGMPVVGAAPTGALKESDTSVPAELTKQPEEVLERDESSGANLSEASVGKSMIAGPESGGSARLTERPKESTTGSEALGDPGRKSADVIAGKAKESDAQFQLIASSVALRDDRSNLDDPDLYPGDVPDDLRRSEINVTPLEPAMKTKGKGTELKTETGKKRPKKSVLSGVPEDEPVLAEPAQMPYRDDGSGERSSEVAVGKSVEMPWEAQEGGSAENKLEERLKSARRQANKARMEVRDAQEGGDENCEKLCRLFEEKKKLPVDTVHSITVIGLDDSGLSAPSPVEVARDDRVFSKLELFNVACGKHSFLKMKYEINEKSPRYDKLLFLTSRDHCKLAMNARQDAANPLFKIGLARLHATNLSMRQEYLLTATNHGPVLDLEADTREPETRELVKKIISSRLPIKIKSVPERDEGETKFIRGNEAPADSPANALFELIGPEQSARRPEGGWPFDIMMTEVESSNVLLMPVIMNKRDNKRDEIVPVGELALHPLEGGQHSSLLREYFPERKPSDQAQSLSPPEPLDQPPPLEKQSASTQMRILAGARPSELPGNESRTIKKASSSRDAESAAGKSL